MFDQRPADVRALWLRARARIEMHLEEQALGDLERAIEREPDAFEIRRAYADVLHRDNHHGAFVLGVALGFKFAQVRNIFLPPR